MLYSSIQVPSEIIHKWQEVVDVLAEIMHVPSALIMRVEPPNIKVFVSSESKGNPYEPDEIAPLDTGLYCETVMKTCQPLLVPDALRDEAWKSNPDIKLGMISYLGVPISWPDGEVFGTICVLDNKRNEYSKPYLRLLHQLRDAVQIDLQRLAAQHRQLEERETKIRRLVDANIIGIYIWELDGRLLEANDTFLRMVGYDREDLISGRVRWTDLTPLEWRDRTARAQEELKRTGAVQPFEKEYVRKDGSRVPVLIGSAAFDERRDQGVAFVLDLTARKRAEAEARESERRYREALMELAHANRVTTMGQLTASISHEMKQPIGAVVANAEAGLNWLDAQPPELNRVRQTLGWIISDGLRAGEIIGRIQGLIKKAPPRPEELEINAAVLEVIALTHGEAVKNGVSVRTQLADGLPLIRVDRVQLQQVVLNLIVNAVEAMSAVRQEPRELLISTDRDALNGVLVSLRDSGPGLDPASLEHVFDPFYTTKPNGMGMGLSICRSIVEAHGGRIWAGANETRGAVFQFRLPLERDETISAECAGQSRRPEKADTESENESPFSATADVSTEIGRRALAHAAPQG
ncbi:GAF domain-containing sensor histidine kinase [Bradyrhizobium sp. DASA03007]|uniref:GAF domain-containing sensor histidine kinase n=1 Tax=unclassified Bradyrhizobium TaxID=2631580 RepID=UPI003F718BBA